MVRGSDKTYGALMYEASQLTERQEVGETNEALMGEFKKIIDNAVQANYEKGITGKYYIHIWLTKEPYTQNAIHIFPQCRRSRPSPYQGNDHYLWSIEDGGKVTFEWCIPKKEVMSYVLKNPNKFDADYVRMLRKYSLDKLEHISDYLVDGKVI